MARVSACKESEDVNLIIGSYFADACSEGSYIIANFYADCVIKEEIKKDNKIFINSQTYSICKEAQDTLDKYEGVIYYKDEDSIYIKNPEALKLDEIQCILATRTGNPNLNSFAAEIVYHAKIALESWNWRNNPSGGIDGFTRYVLSLFLYSHAIKADLSVLDNDKPGEDLYKSYNGTFVIEQRSIWGDK